MYPTYRIQPLNFFRAVCVVNYFNGHYYELREDVGTQAQAITRSAASSFRGVAGHLVTIESDVESAFVYTISPTTWIAASDATTESTWVYNSGPSTGAQLSYTGWASGQPDNAGNQDCAYTWLNSAPPNNWDDIICSSTMVFIVEYECPMGKEFNATGCQGIEISLPCFVCLFVCIFAPPPIMKYYRSLNPIDVPSPLSSCISELILIFLGHIARALIFLDINMCLVTPCGGNATCTDLAAPSLSRNCTCNTGYDGNATAGCTSTSDFSRIIGSSPFVLSILSSLYLFTLSLEFQAQAPWSTRFTDLNACLTQPCARNATCYDDSPPLLTRICLCDTGFEGDGVNSCTGMYNAVILFCFTKPFSCDRLCLSFSLPLSLL
jgi:hypothetical protein